MTNRATRTSIVNLLCVTILLELSLLLTDYSHSASIKTQMVHIREVTRRHTKGPREYLSLILASLP